MRNTQNCCWSCWNAVENSVLRTWNNSASQAHNLKNVCSECMWLSTVQNDCIVTCNVLQMWCQKDLNENEKKISTLLGCDLVLCFCKSNPILHTHRFQTKLPFIWVIGSFCCWKSEGWLNCKWKMIEVDFRQIAQKFTRKNFWGFTHAKIVDFYTKAWSVTQRWLSSGMRTVGFAEERDCMGCAH